ncbi:uncharacterized protein LOC115787050 [Archocentrus centrarchus]|uniref:uncharacterized protein LOC115787050 n=1 Tax=Archocentrus centrarchus TaxID=63155 RepID=UPI0011E9D091|nr:uncharacterized protein LOC115787050 [Archocentrus centrarchus]
MSGFTELAEILLTEGWKFVHSVCLHVFPDSKAFRGGPALKSADPHRLFLSSGPPERTRPAHGQQLRSGPTTEPLKQTHLFSFFFLQKLPAALTQKAGSGRQRFSTVGEVGAEISKELSVDGVRPVSPDREALSTICTPAEDTARRLMEQENSILEHQEEDVSEEELTYTEMKSHWKQKEFIAKSLEDYVSRTSNYETLKEVKAQREKYAESS